MSEPHEEQRPRSSNQAIFDRVGSVERQLADVRSQIAGMTVTLESQAATLTRIATTMEQRQNTDWKALASWASVIIALVGLGGTMILAPIRQQVTSNTASVDRLNEGRILDARAALSDARREQLDAVERGRYLERIDQLQRELEKERGAP